MKIPVRFFKILLELDLSAVVLKDSYVHAEGLKLFNEDFEGFRNSRLRDILSLDDSLVCLNTSNHVVRLHGEHFLKRICSSVCLKGPDLHLTETLASELCLTA